MKVPFRLVPRPSPEPAVAAIFPGGRVVDAIETCTRRGLSPWGRLFATADGPLVKFGSRVDGPIPGAIRLRALADDLLIPVDADLLPALLDDERLGLTRDRGLVSLPGGRFLAYDPADPIEPGRLLGSTGRRSDGWAPFPSPEPISDRIESIELELDDPFQTAVFETLPRSEGEGEGEDANAADDPAAQGSPASQALGQASLGLGRGMIWLGKTLGIRSLAEQGARWIQQAIERAPRLSEAVLGRQSAEIQALLKEFREGDPNRALGKAMPIGGDHPGRGSSLSAADRLAEQDTRYSLASLLGGQGGGGSGYWMGAEDLIAALAREYRKAASAALQAGDFRRAAYIYGKLLRDFRTAAGALRSGGLHRDAALVYLHRLDDRRSAARAFEAAGDLDQAVKLYRALHDHVSAADVLRRMGEEDEAQRHYEQAALELIGKPGGSLTAGNLMLDRARRDDLALRYFADGWKQRPAPGDLACAQRLLQVRAARQEHREFLEVLDEAGQFLASAGAGPEAPRFFNQIMALGPNLPDEVADEVRDRARLGLAGELRARLAHGQRASAMVSDLFGQQPHWDRGLVADADLAARREAGRVGSPRPSPASPASVRVGSGLVTAVAGSPESGDLFLGFDNGDLYCFRSETGEATRIAGGSQAIVALSAAPSGDWVIALRTGRSHSTRARRGNIIAHERDRTGLYQARVEFTIDDLANPWLTPIRRGDVGWRVGLWDGQSLYFLTLPGLVECGALTPTVDHQDGPTTGLLLPEFADQLGPSILWHDGRGWAVASPRQGDQDADPSSLADGLVATDPNRPGTAFGSPLRTAWLDSLWSWLAAQLQIVWGDEQGALYWRRIDFHNRQTDQPHQRLTTAGGFRHAALVRAGLIAGLAENRVEWIRIGPLGIRIVAVTPVDLFTPIACFISETGRTLAVVGLRGEIARLPVPTT